MSYHSAKGGLITLYDRIQKERHRLQQEIDSIQTELQNLPDGKLICSQNGNRVKWYQSDGHTKTYIPKKQRNLAEQLIHKTASGKFVRSKSEALIDLYLFTKKIPFRYECALHLGEITLFPDFTIMHPETGELYYWEHFGMMDEPAYYKNVFSKLQLYASYGIVPTINLITTYETKKNPLSSEVIEKTLHTILSKNLYKTREIPYFYCGVYINHFNLRPHTSYPLFPKTDFKGLCKKTCHKTPINKKVRTSQEVFLYRPFFIIIL